MSADERQAKAAAMSLLRASSGRKGRLPENKAQEFKHVIGSFFAIEATSVSQADIERASCLGQGPSPSERICAEATKDTDSLRVFLRKWRELFLNTLQPRYLADGWAVDTGLDGCFVPSVASSLEWPGDWRCSECGVHCFGRSSACRSCGAQRDGPEDRVVDDNCTS